MVKNAGKNHTSLFEKGREYYQYSREKIKFLIYQYFDKEILSALLQIGKIGIDLAIQFSWLEVSSEIYFRYSKPGP